MAETANIHERIRDAVATALGAVNWGAADLPGGVVRMNAFVGAQVDMPCIVVSYELGTEQVRGGTNLEDDVAYPVAVGLFTAGPVNDDSAAGGPSITKFRDACRALFLNRSLAGVDEVYACEFVGQPMVQRDLPGYEKLKTAVGVVAVARVPRTPTWSA